MTSGREQLCRDIADTAARECEQRERKRCTEAMLSRAECEERAALAYLREYEVAYEECLYYGGA